MEPEQMNEVLARGGSIYEGLCLGQCNDGVSYTPVCRFLVAPTFEIPIDWEVIEVVAPGAGPESRLYRSRWRRDIDGNVLRFLIERHAEHRDPYVPTFEVDWVSIEEGRLESVMARLRSTPVPLAFESPPSGCDGTTFELSFGESFCSTRIRWWSRLPTELQQLQPIVEELEQLFEQSWARAARPRVALDSRHFTVRGEPASEAAPNRTHSRSPRRPF